MDTSTLIIYIIMYIYGFSLTLWAIFFDKNPTKKSFYGAIIGLIGLLLTLVYFFYVLWNFGIN